MAQGRQGIETPKYATFKKSPPTMCDNFSEASKDIGKFNYIIYRCGF